VQSIPPLGKLITYDIFRYPSYAVKLVNV
jgi:hypothetical protein